MILNLLNPQSAHESKKKKKKNRSGGLRNAL